MESNQIPRSDRVYKRLRDFAEKRRTFEIGLLWKRAWLFWGFTAVGFAAYTYSLEHTNEFGYGVGMMVAGFGFITSFIWTLVNRGSKFWQEYWEDQIDRVTEESIKHKQSNYKFFEDAKNYQPRNKGFWSGARFSPSKLIIALSDYVTAAWFVIGIMQCAIMLGTRPEQLIVQVAIFAIIGTLGYAIWIWKSARKHGDCA